MPKQKNKTELEKEIEILKKIAVDKEYRDDPLGSYNIEWGIDLLKKGASLKVKEIFEDKDIEVSLCNCFYGVNSNNEHTNKCLFIIKKKKHLGEDEK